MRVSNSLFTQFQILALPSNKSGSRKGFALFAVTISLFVLGLIAAAVMRTTLIGARLARAQEIQTRALYVAQSAMELAAYDALDALTISSGGTTRNYMVAAYPVVVRISDEAGRVDINEANEALLSAVFASLDATPSAASQLAAAIIDWRDSDDFAKLDGAEIAQYQALGLSYGPRNGPFETLGELRQVRGMTDQMFSCAFPLLTIYADSADVNFDVASQDVLNVFRWANANSWLGQEWQITEPSVDNGEIQVLRSDGSGTSLRMDIVVTASERLFTFKAFVRLTQTRRLPFEILSFSTWAPNQQTASCWP